MAPDVGSGQPDRVGGGADHEPGVVLQLADQHHGGRALGEPPHLDLAGSTVALGERTDDGVAEPEEVRGEGRREGDRVVEAPRRGRIREHGDVRVDRLERHRRGGARRSWWWCSPSWWSSSCRRSPPGSSSSPLSTSTPTTTATMAAAAPMPMNRRLRWSSCWASMSFSSMLRRASDEGSTLDVRDSMAWRRRSSGVIAGPPDGSARLARPRWACVLTDPAEMPSVRAISASDRSR